MEERTTDVNNWTVFHKSGSAAIDRFVKVAFNEIWSETVWPKNEIESNLLYISFELPQVRIQSIEILVIW